MTMSRQPISIEEMQAVAEQHLMATLSREVNDTFRQLAQEAPPATANPALAALASDVLRALRKEDAAPAIYHAVARYLAGSGDEADALLRLPRGLQVFYLSSILELELLNGGAHQFFWNTSDQMTCLIPVALRELGAHQAAQLFEEARLIACAEADDRGVSLDDFLKSSAKTSLARFDPPLCAQAQRFPALRAAYLRAHQYLFMP